MNDLTIFENPEFGKIRTTELDGEPWFVGKDVATALQYKDTKDALKKHVDKEDKQIIQRGQNTALEIPNRGLTLINESGLYSLIFGSKMKKAHEFKHWVTHEVLPQIRKTGTYGIHLPDGSINLDLIQALIDNERKLQEEKKELMLVNTAQSLQIAEMQPKVTYYDLVLDSKDVICTTAIAKDYGYSAQNFNKLLHELGVQYKCDGQWVLYQKYAAEGYTQTKTRILDNGHVIVWTYWKQKGRLFLYDLLKSNGILPIIEREDKEAV